MNNVHFLYDVDTYTDEIIIDGKEMAKAILKDVLTNEIQFFNKDGNIK